MVPVVAFRVGQVRAAEFRVVGVHGREMGEQSGAVDSLPVERVVRHLVGLVPGDFLGQEPAAARSLDDLRQGCRVAEGIREPGFAALDAELGQEEALAFQELARHCLPAGHVGVGLHPHATHGNELASADLLPDPGKQFGVELLDPGKLLGGGARKHKAGVLVHQRHHVGEGPGAFADGFAHRPQPGRIDVGVPGGHEPVRGSVGGPGEYFSQGGPAGDGGTGNVIRIHQVEHALQGTEDFVAPGKLRGQLRHEAREGPDVLLQLPDLLLQFGDGDAPQPVLRGCSCRGLVAVRGGGKRPALGHIGVGCRLHVEIHRHAAAQELQRDVLVAGRDGLDDAAVRPPGDAFALETRHLGAEPKVNHHLDGGARPGAPRFGHFALCAQPGGPPGFAPGGVVFLGNEVLAHGIQRRHGLAGNLPAGQCQRQAAAVDGRVDALTHEPLKAHFRDAAVVMQSGSSLALGSGP